MPRPVAIARLLVERGVSLRKAHGVLDRLASGGSHAVEVDAEDLAGLMTSFAEIGITALEIRRPTIDAKQVRETFALSQKDFATRFGLELRTIQNWEQQRYDLDPTATILLALIRECPSAVERVLTTNAETGGLSATPP